MLKRRNRIALVLFCIVLLTACHSPDASKTKLLRLAHGLPVEHPVHRGMACFAEKVSEYSNRQIEIKIYPGGQLGGERECIESLQIGSLDMTKVNSAVVENFVPSLAVLSLPYLFVSTEHRWKVLNSEIGEKMLRDGEKYWLHGLCFYETGTRNFYLTKKPVRRPEDLRGLKIRVMQSYWSIASVQALGASVSPISFGELFSALAAGVVDGAENNIPTFFQSRHWEICKYFVLDGHSAPSDMLLISTWAWNRLNPQEQDILARATRESVVFQRQLWDEAEIEYLKTIRQGGVEVIHPDRELFKDHVKSLYEELERTNPELFQVVQTIRAMMPDTTAVE